jgi:hypothetical protein
LAAAISKMHGVGGKPAWVRFINPEIFTFHLTSFSTGLDFHPRSKDDPFSQIHQSMLIKEQGLATVLAGFMSFWIIQDFPDTAKFLSDRERAPFLRFPL